MFDKHAKGFRKSLSFVQETGFYVNDTLRKTATWYEVLVYPDKLRIDIDDPRSGNAIYFVNDSAYRFQKGELKGRNYQPHDLVFVLGGMYSFSLEEAYKKLKAIGYDTEKTYTTTWKGRPVVVLGTDKDETESNQFWVDAEKLVTVRILNNKNGQKTEILCDDYVPLGQGLCETSIQFFINGKLRQTEKYRELKENFTLDMDYFDPGKMGKVEYWGK
ncbi:MAG: hypothetical protein IPI66_10720 [Chitinophagaceae bacterium]|nr:hypothetical protein [Chitinophagaceae bacterium]